MKVFCLSENLASAFATCSRTVSTKPNLPILSNVLFETENNRLRISATNLESSITLQLGAKIEKEGEITIPARSFFEYISSISPQKVKLEIKENKFIVEGTDTSAKFVTMNPTDFPSIPEVSEKSVLEIECQIFATIIKKTTFAVASDEGRPVLTGILIKKQDGKIIAVATDGFRLSEVEVKESENMPDFSVIVPGKSLVELERLLAETEEEKLKVSFSKDKNQVAFNLVNVEFVTRLLEASFPDYEKIIPTDFRTKVKLNVEGFKKAVKLSSIFAKANGQTVKLDFSSQKSLLTVSGQSAQLGEQEGKLEEKIEGDDLKIAFNAKFLLDGLNSIETEQVIFEARDSLSPAMLRPEGKEGYRHIIMPIRMEG